MTAGGDCQGGRGRLTLAADADAAPRRAALRAQGGSGLAKTSKDPAAQRTVRYAEHLEHQIRHAPKSTKGARTKDQLKLAAIRVLDEVGYHAMRVSDICEAAGVGGATFYLYFKNKAAITLEVLAEFSDYTTELLSMTPGESNAFESIRTGNLRWLQAVRANAGLVRCTLQLGDDEPAFQQLVNQMNHRWYERIAHSVLRNYPRGAVSPELGLLAAYSLGSMMDELIRKLLVYPDPALQQLVDRVAPSDEALADFLSVLWHQALYGRAPQPTGDLSAAARAFADAAS